MSNQAKRWPGIYYRLLLILPLLMLIGWGCWNEFAQYHSTKHQINLEGEHAGRLFANRIEGRLNNAYKELALIGALLSDTPPSSTSAPRTLRLFKQLEPLHPELYAINIYAADGQTRLWSSKPDADIPVSPIGDFTPLPAQPNYLLGPDRIVNHVPVISLRLRKTSADGTTLLYVSLIYRLKDLLAYYPTDDKAWQFTVIDRRDHSILGIYQNGQLRFNNAPLAEAHGLIPVTDYPLAVQTEEPADLILQSYQESARERLDLYLGMFLVLSMAAWSIYTLLRQRERDARHLKHLADVNALLAQVNQAMAVSRDETGFMEEICALAVKYGGFRLAYIAKPDKTGLFQILAAAGATGYTEDLKIVSDPDLPEGQGPVGHAWRSQYPVYAQELKKTPGLTPWLARAEKFGIHSSATIPILKNGNRWAVLATYHSETQVFSDEMRHLLEDLAQDITRGLHWIETQRREALLTATQQALLDNTLAGIVMVRDRHMVQVTARFVIMLGYTHPDELLGQSTHLLYASEEDYERVGQGYLTLMAQGKLTIPDVRFARKDGSVIICDLSASMIQDEELTTSVWTIQDITQRHNLQKELAKTSAYQRALFDSNAAALLTVDAEGAITDANPALCLLTGYDREELFGNNASILQDENAAVEYFATHFSAAPGGPFRTIHQENTIRHKNGTILNVEILGAAISLPNGQPGVIWSLIDVTALHKAKQEIAYQALHDTLTGLPNRRALEQHLPRAIARAQRNSTVVAVGMLDLDDFKPVNDNFGHEGGDTLLRELAARLQSRLRKQDLLARLGGDEFVIVLEDLVEDRLIPQLEIALDRLHQAVETPFEVASQKYAKIGMSIGIAFYPADGEQGDGLLRQADAALYTAKMNKATRTKWWRIIHDAVVPQDKEHYFDAYSPESQALMVQCTTYLHDQAEPFIRKFYAELGNNPVAQKILGTLEASAFPRLIATQSKHLCFLLNPETTRKQITERAQHIGATHALVGVNSPLLMQSMNLYRKLLNDYLNQSPLNGRERYHILVASEARIQDDILAQLQAGGTTIQDHFDLLTHPLPVAGSLWADVKVQEIERLGTLPGIQAVLLMRPDTEGVFTVESSAGHKGSLLASAVSAPGRQINTDPVTPRGRSLTSLAWRTLNIQSTPNILQDDRYAEWHELARELNITSTLSLPIMSGNGRLNAALSLYGQYPNQFETVWMQQFVRNLQLRLSQAWLLCNNPGPVISQQLSQNYREELFSGGLCVHMQPIVDLRTGALIKVEALARLKRPDGTIIPPGEFLPLLGDTELDRLFCLVLDQALPWLSHWDQAGVELGLSVNLSPGTLLDPNCCHWIETALSKHGIQPARLTLEILETQGIDQYVQDSAIQKLVALGVPLAMDDLGSGYSSLHRLASLPFNIIKIDQSLVAEIRTNPVQTMSLIAAIIQMGNDFDQTVIVEGLEDAGVIEAVSVLGAHFGQGFALAHPMPPEEILPWLQRCPPRPADTGLRTFLGALAYHWWLIHTGHKTHPLKLDDCPLNQFLTAQGHAQGEAARWHQAIHGSQENRVANQNLIAWLAKHAQREMKNESGTA
ncbi:MAG TPA: EAL domain-containing protein [Halothiobacillus sp.]|nr:EAL domain-containing protein [Halothiobacillus sp.]